MTTESAGLECRCGGALAVIETRRTNAYGDAGAVRRRRACVKCGERCTTVEVRVNPTLRQNAKIVATPPRRLSRARHEVAAAAELERELAWGLW